jgi:hypothetical protein
MNKEIIKISSICIGVCSIVMIQCNHTLPGLIGLCVACLGGMLCTSKNVIGN